MTQADPTPRTAESLSEARLMIEELEAMMSSERLLDGVPHELTVTGYQISIDSAMAQQFAMEYATNLTTTGLDDALYAQSVDAMIAFPGDDITKGVSSFTQNWTNGYAWTFAHTNSGPISYISHNNKIIEEPTEHHIDRTQAILAMSGLPLAGYDGSRSDMMQFEKLLLPLALGSQSLRHLQQREVAIDPVTKLRIVHESLIVGTPNGESSDRGIVQELRLELQHFEDFANPTSSALNIPTCFEVYADHVIFRRSKDDARWEYYACYHGPVSPGELLGVEVDRTEVNQLTSPKLGVIAKVLSATQYAQS